MKNKKNNKLQTLCKTLWVTRYINNIVLFRRISLYLFLVFFCDETFMVPHHVGSQVVETKKHLRKVIKLNKLIFFHLFCP